MPDLVLSEVGKKKLEHLLERYETFTHFLATKAKVEHTPRVGWQMNKLEETNFSYLDDTTYFNLIKDLGHLKGIVGEFKKISEMKRDYCGFEELLYTTDLVLDELKGFPSSGGLEHIQEIREGIKEDILKAQSLEKKSKYSKAASVYFNAALFKEGVLYLEEMRNLFFHGFDCLEKEGTITAFKELVGESKEYFFQKEYGISDKEEKRLRDQISRFYKKITQENPRKCKFFFVKNPYPIK